MENPISSGTLCASANQHSFAHYKLLFEGLKPKSRHVNADTTRNAHFLPHPFVYFDGRGQMKMR